MWNRCKTSSYRHILAGVHIHKLLKGQNPIRYCWQWKNQVYNLDNGSQTYTILQFLCGQILQSNTKDNISVCSNPYYKCQEPTHKMHNNIAHPRVQMLGQIGGQGIHLNFQWEEKAFIWTWIKKDTLTAHPAKISAWLEHLHESIILHAGNWIF